MKRLFVLTAVILAAVLVFAACGSNGGEINEPTKAPEATEVPSGDPTPEPTATPEPTPEPTPSPVPEPGTYDLLNFEPDETRIAGDTWSVIDGQWSGPFMEPHEEGAGGATLDGANVFLHREVMATNVSDGTVGPVIRHSIDGDEGYRIGTNRYGIAYAGIKANTKYRIKATFMVLGGRVDDGGSGWNDVVLGYGNGLGDIPGDDRCVVLESKEEWQTKELVITTGANDAEPCIILGTRASVGAVPYDYEMYIESVELYEVVE